MGLFNRLKNNKKEEIKIIDGYEIGVDSGIIYHCPKGLTEYILPNGAKSLSDGACREMKDTVETLDVPASFSEFTSIGGQNSLILINSKTLKNIHFNEGIQDIKPALFDYRNVRFNVPNSVTHLRVGAYEPDDKGKLTITDQVTSMEAKFASHDLFLQEVEITGNIKKIPVYAFNQCRNIRKVILHDGIEECEQDAFRGTNNLKVVELPETFNGNFDAPMEGRKAKIKRFGKEYYYDAENLEQEMNSPLTINVKRLGQKYTFQIRRGDFYKLSLNGNMISFNEKGLLCDITGLNPDELHTIADGRIESITSTTSQEKMKSNINNNISVSGFSSSFGIDYSKYDIKQINQVIENIENRTGLEYRLLDEEDISDDDRYLLALALNIKIKILESKEKSAINIDGIKTLRKDIKNLEFKDIIPSFEVLRVDNRIFKNKYSKMFEDEIKSIEEIQGTHSTDNLKEIYINRGINQTDLGRGLDTINRTKQQLKSQMNYESPEGGYEYE